MGEPETVIRVENLSKRYVISHNDDRGRYSTLRDTIAHGAKSLVRRVLGRGDPGVDQTREEFWALKDVSFEVKRGDVVGIIGRNGAGKSTLLKILSRITEPTTGRIAINGRVASLLEVGTGFHPELTGRENVFLNGSILGMTRAEVKRKFDEIVAFAEIEKFLDTPVKRYSSGMYMRLAFAVAAHLEPEILIVDEVLAVGDVGFQKKCLGKMGEVAKGGRTVLFVSHNIGTVMNLCGKGIHLDAGKSVFVGKIREVVASYYGTMTREDDHNLNRNCFQGTLVDSLVLRQLIVNGETIPGLLCVSPHKPITFKLIGEVFDEIVPDFRTTISVFRDGVRVLSLHDVDLPTSLTRGQLECEFDLPARLLRPGEYQIAVGGHRVNGVDYLWGTNVAQLLVEEEWGPGYYQADHGLINLGTIGRRINH